MSRLEELDVATVEWGVFSLEIANNDQGADGVDPLARGIRGLRTAIAVRDELGNAAMGRFYGALGHRYFEMLESYREPATFEQALADAGLDPAIYQHALDDERTWTAVVREHDQLVSDTGAFGVPVLRVDGTKGPAIFGPVISEMPDDADAVALYEHVSWLTRFPSFAELKRDRTVPLDLERARRR